MNKNDHEDFIKRNIIRDEIEKSKIMTTEEFLKLSPIKRLKVYSKELFLTVIGAFSSLFIFVLLLNIITFISKLILSIFNINTDYHIFVSLIGLYILSQIINKPKKDNNDDKPNKKNDISFLD